MNIFDQILNEPSSQTETVVNQVPKSDSADSKIRSIQEERLSRHPIKALDPRPDLTADTKWWTQLLAVAQDMDPSLEFYGTLLGFRCMGTRLVLLQDGTFRMRAMTIQDNTGKDCWASPDEYRAAAIRWLGPADNPNEYGRMLKEVLQKMSLSMAA